MVQTLSDEQVAEDNITINIQREDLPPLEMARMVDSYIKQFKKTQQEAADKFGRKIDWVKHLLGLLSIPEPVRERCKALHLGWEHLRALKQASPPIQDQVSKELEAGTLEPNKVLKRCNQLRFGGGKASPTTPKRGGSRPRLARL